MVVCPKTVSGDNAAGPIRACARPDIRNSGQTKSVALHTLERVGQLPAQGVRRQGQDEHKPAPTRNTALRYMSPAARRPHSLLMKPTKRGL